MSFDTQAQNQAFALKCAFPFPLLCDTTREVGIAYGAAENASASGPKRISYLIGPDATILKAYRSVSPASHPEEVLDDLAKLHSAKQT